MSIEPHGKFSASRIKTASLARWPDRRIASVQGFFINVGARRADPETRDSQGHRSRKFQCFALPNVCTGSVRQFHSTLHGLPDGSHSESVDRHPELRISYSFPWQSSTHHPVPEQRQPRHEKHNLPRALRGPGLASISRIADRAAQFGFVVSYLPIVALGSHIYYSNFGISILSVDQKRVLVNNIFHKIERDRRA